MNEVVDANKDDLRTAISNFKDISLRFRELTSSLSEIVVPHEEDLKVIIGSSRKVFESLEKAARSLEIVSEKIEKGEGPIGGLVHDQELYDEIKDAVKNFNELARDVRKHPWKLLRKGRQKR